MTLSLFGDENEFEDEDDDFLQELNKYTEDRQQAGWDSVNGENNRPPKHKAKKAEDSIVQKVYGQEMFRPQSNCSTATPINSSTDSSPRCHDYLTSSKQCKFGDKCNERHRLLCSYYHGNDPLLARQFCYCTDKNCARPHPNRAKAKYKNQRTDTDKKKLICKSCGGPHTIHFCPNMK